ncbi:TIGR03085 family metal-binding protein [Ilumatobacter nonamiensis]|uniref:TIGR03085 family metal-binding protein n=1 Tax=Ilumatobacter nonamiensis TaxID=467093 RepID=UPI00034D6019|nr:TIGR03085 family metal-binding protein [Ilumatobacter nonamiensis]
MANDTNPARRERAALCDLFLELGPDQPTLCGEWTTRDLAAHLVIRERRPDAAVGILVSKAAGYTEKVQAGVADAEWSDLVDTVRSGPPFWSPTRIAAVDALANTAEFFVHHEDVRRAQPTWEPRSLDDDLVDALYDVLKKTGKRFVSKSPVGIVLEPDDDHSPITVKQAEPSVTVRGPVGELVMFVHGRQERAAVELFGDDESVAAANSASFGI